MGLAPAVGWTGGSLEGTHSWGMGGCLSGVRTRVKAEGQKVKSKCEDGEEARAGCF